MQKIAVIEDETPIRDMYLLKLKSSGYDARGAENGQAGLKLIEDFSPSLILLDLKMPVMTGDEMLKKLRETERGSDIRVVILTNISKEEAPHSLRLLHVDRYILKALYTPRQVVEIVEEVLGLNMQSNRVP
jgi:DNA-binding response OmpR family regulator